MALTKEQKQRIVADLREKIGKQKIVIFTDFTGFKVEDFSILRKKLKTANSDIKVAKKTLMKLVFKEKGLKIDEKILKGEIALVFGYKDEILPAKIVYELTQGNENLKILGGIFENEFREAEEIITLAQISTKEVLLAKLVGSISSPISGLMNVLQGNIRSLIYIVSQIKPST